jgi:hypothetical protein
MKRKKGCLGIKLDFHKAYDRMEWKFIEQVLKALGFDQKFTSLVLQCITTVNYTLLPNGSKGLSFTPSRDSDREILYLPIYLFWPTRCFQG